VNEIPHQFYAPDIIELLLVLEYKAVGPSGRLEVEKAEFVRRQTIMYM
jgi:hypothetical protein